MSFQERTVQELYGNEGVEEIESIIQGLPSKPKIDEKKIDVSDILKNWTIADIKAKFGALYYEVLRVISQKKKGKNIDEVLKYLDYRLKNILDLFVDTQIYNNVGNHLRDYQDTFVKGILDFIFLNTKQTGYIHSATSSGKTTVFADVIRNILQISPSQKILITVPSIEALDRAKKELSSLGIRFGEFTGKSKDSSESVTIATVQTLLNHIGKVQSGELKQGLQPTDFDLMISDEIHNRLLGKQTRSILSYFQCKKVGFTATPELLDKSVEELFEVKIGEYLVDDAIADGFLPKINDDYNIELDDVEFQKLKKVGDDYSGESLAKIDVTHTFPSVVKLLQGGFKGKQIAIFLPSVQASKNMAAFLEKNGISASHIDGSMSKTARDKVKGDFESKNIQVICNCEVLRESWDSDAIEGIINLRPTLSPSVYMQMIGRALHGKMIEDGKKVPKKEVFVADVVSNRAKIVSRNITTRSLKYLMNITGQATGKNRNIAYIEATNYINEILLYYDISGGKGKSAIDIFYKTLDTFRKLFAEDEETFFENLNTDDTSYFHKKERINLELTSNNLFGSSFSQRKRDVEVDIELFLHMFKSIYGEKTIQDLLSKKSVASLEKYVKNIKFEDFKKLIEMFGKKIYDKIEIFGKLYGRGELGEILFFSRLGINISNLKYKNSFFHAFFTLIIEGKITTFEQLQKEYEDYIKRDDALVKKKTDNKIPLKIDPDIAQAFQGNTDNKNTDITDYDFFAKLFFEDLRDILLRFRTRDFDESTDKIIGISSYTLSRQYQLDPSLNGIHISWYQTWNAILHYILGVTSDNERQKYSKVIQWVLFLVRNQEIHNFGELKSKFEELKDRKVVGDKYEYLMKKIANMDFKRIRQYATRELSGDDDHFGFDGVPNMWKINRTPLDITWGEVYEGILKFRLGVKKKWNIQDYKYIIKVLFHKIQEREISSWEEFEAQFHIYKAYSIREIKYMLLILKEKSIKEISVVREYMQNVPFELFLEFMYEIDRLNKCSEKFHTFLVSKGVKKEEDFSPYMEDFNFLILIGKLGLYEEYQKLWQQFSFAHFHRTLLLQTVFDSWQEYSENIVQKFGKMSESLAPISFEEFKKNLVLRKDKIHLEWYIKEACIPDIYTSADDSEIKMYKIGRVIKLIPEIVGGKINSWDELKAKL